MTVRYSNRDLHQRILNALEHDPRLDTSDLRIAVHDGIITLSGHVPSCAQEHILNEVLRRLTGVQGIENDVQGHLPPDHKRTDPALTDLVETVLRHTVQVPSEQIQVTVDDGCVTLNGVVTSNFQRRRATRALRFLTGIKTINNLLDLQEQPTPDDLNEQIRHTLDRRLSADTSRLQTSVEGNSVTVSGTVNSWTIRDQVEALILSLPGVVDVDNQLRVSHTTSV